MKRSLASLALAAATAFSVPLAACAQETPQPVRASAANNNVPRAAVEIFMGSVALDPATGAFRSSADVSTEALAGQMNGRVAIRRGVDGVLRISAEGSGREYFSAPLYNFDTVSDDVSLLPRGVNTACGSTERVDCLDEALQAAQQDGLRLVGWGYYADPTTPTERAMRNGHPVIIMLHMRDFSAPGVHNQFVITRVRLETEEAATVYTGVNATVTPAEQQYAALDLRR